MDTARAEPVAKQPVPQLLWRRAASDLRHHTAVYELRKQIRRRMRSVMARIQRRVSDAKIRRQIDQQRWFFSPTVVTSGLDSSPCSSADITTSTSANCVQLATDKARIGQWQQRRMDIGNRFVFLAAAVRRDFGDVRML